jgi:hypothetical protein
MMIRKDELDKRICDIEEETTNTQTYREFIQQSENEFGMEPQNLDSMTQEELNKYLNFLDYLWTK